MADGRGGRQPPDGKPRPVSGPGRYSQRSDMSQPQGQYTPTGGAYGQAQAAQRAQAAAPLPNRRTPPPQATPVGLQTPGAAATPPQVPQDLLSLLARPTNRPEEAVTAGLPMGAGPGAEAMPRQQRSAAAEVLSYLASLPFSTENVRRLAVEVDRQPPPELMI